MTVLVFVNEGLACVWLVARERYSNWNKCQGYWTVAQMKLCLLSVSLLSFPNHCESPACVAQLHLPQTSQHLLVDDLEIKSPLLAAVLQPISSHCLY